MDQSDDEFAASIRRRKVLTTGQAARVLRVSRQSVIRACNRQVIPSYVVPGTKHRRITLDALLAWMRENGATTDLFLETARQEATA